jgi:hypothetical protein
MVNSQAFAEASASLGWSLPGLGHRRPKGKVCAADMSNNTDHIRRI